ncbi:hypothetical protein PoB_003901500 [Plakobranchus ocellatus]|uniref:Uncharacterized protein n=1 Tax=Plakobranchus ocellatus TaxID=259542 RepID=A0AAV4B0B0_9GAST|nr:hypothetical protein PoB_003901500 [Plakobranchus ocellatus]
MGKAASQEWMVQLSMDGLDVNWEIFNSFSKEAESETSQIFLCNISRMSKSGFNISSLHWLFQDSPARWEAFNVITESYTLSLSYCGHCWLENVACIERGLWSCRITSKCLCKRSGTKQDQSRLASALQQSGSTLQIRSHIQKQIWCVR